MRIASSQSGRDCCATFWPSLTDFSKSTMSKTVFSLYEAKTSLSKLVDRAAAGEEIVIAKNGKPMAKLVGVPQPRLPRKPGGWEGQGWIADDFDDPLPWEIQKYFEGEGD